MPRILLVCEYATLHGGERSLLAVLGELSRQGCRFAAVAPAGPLSDALRGLGVELLPPATEGQSSQRARRDRLAALMRAFQPDLVHANSVSMSRLAGPVVFQLRIPSIGHLRDIVRLSRRAVENLNLHSRLLAVSRATRDWHVAAGLDPAKTCVAYNGVDLVQFRPQPANGWLHRELGLPRGARLVGSIGQLGIRKGFDLVLDAAERLTPRIGDIHFVFVGGRFSGKAEAIRYERTLRDRAASVQLAGRVHFLGVRDDVPRLLDEFTLLVHAARQEPLGRVLLEAAAAGTAIVATDVGGTREIFPPEQQAAKLVPAGDSIGLAAAVEELLASPQRRAAMAAAARARAEQRFDARQTAAELLSHYRQVMSG